jgi:hypothetical protein
VTELDPDAVQVLAAALHAVECLPGARPGHRWSQADHRAHQRKAERLLARCAETGMHLTSKEG